MEEKDCKILEAEDIREVNGGTDDCPDGPVRSGKKPDPTMPSEPQRPALSSSDGSGSTSLTDLLEQLEQSGFIHLQ